MTRSSSNPPIRRRASAQRALRLAALVLALAFALGCAGTSPPATGPSNAAAPAPTAENAEWRAFLGRLAATGDTILASELPASAQDRAEGQRYLLQRLAAVIDEALDAESGPPIVALYSHKLRKYGMDSADAKYATVRVDPTGTYRLSGELGNAHHIAFQLTTSRAGWASFESINRAGLDATPSGEFELLVSAVKPADWKKPWLRLDPRSSELMLREYFYDWASEQPSRFEIERLDRPGASVPIEPAATSALYGAIAEQFAATVPRWFAASLDDRNHRPNQLGPPRKSASEGLLDNAYGSGWFRLEPDQALVIELARPDAHLWSFELGSFWWQSLDYVDHTSSLNGFQAVAGSDGRYRLVISLVDPGVPNWLDPVGHREGVIIYRYQLARGSNAIPTARVVPLAELRQVLPPDTPQVTPAQREAEIAIRRRHAAVRWAP